jgi:hypothetical protein
MENSMTKCPKYPQLGNTYPLRLTFEMKKVMIAAALAFAAVSASFAVQSAPAAACDDPLSCG